MAITPKFDDTLRVPKEIERLYAKAVPLKEAFEGTYGHAKQQIQSVLVKLEEEDQLLMLSELLVSLSKRSMWSEYRTPLATCAKAMERIRDTVDEKNSRASAQEPAPAPERQKLIQGSSPLRSRSGFDGKDSQRIEDLIAKSRDDRHAQQLAINMANKITDAQKAYRRGLAAEDENFHDLAAIFFDRADSLQGKSAQKYTSERLKQFAPVYVPWRSAPLVR